MKISLFSRKRLELMETPESFYQEILDQVAGGVYFVDPDRHITFWNQAAEEITGFSRTEVLGHACFDNLLRHIDAQGVQLCLNGCPLQATLQDGQPRQAEVFLHHRDGHRVPVSVQVSPIKEKNRGIIGAVELFTNNTPKLVLQERIQELEALSFLDGLTDLANRRYVEIILQSRLEEMHRYGWPMGVILMDLDYFKHVNDTYGHDVGDRVLKTVSNTLAGNLRHFDVCGRWGGEEFLSVIVNVTAPELFAIADRLRILVGKSHIPVPGSFLQVTVSAGATLARPQDTLDTIFKRADQLLYDSKRSGRNRVTMDWPGEQQGHGG